MPKEGSKNGGAKNPVMSIRLSEPTLAKVAEVIALYERMAQSAGLPGTNYTVSAIIGFALDSFAAAEIKRITAVLADKKAK